MPPILSVDVIGYFRGLGLFWPSSKMFFRWALKKELTRMRVSAKNV